MSSDGISPNENEIMQNNISCGIVQHDKIHDKDKTNNHGNSSRVTLREKQFDVQKHQEKISSTNNAFEVYEFEPSLSTSDGQKSTKIVRSSKSSFKKNSIGLRNQRPFWLRPSVVGAPPNRSRRRRYKCKKCSYITNQSKQFLHHKVYVHSERIQIHACSVCEYACNSRHKLQRHWNLIHSRSDRSNVQLGCNLTSESKQDQLSTVLENPIQSQDFDHFPTNSSVTVIDEEPQEDSELDKEVATINSEQLSMFDWLKMPSPMSSNLESTFQYNLDQESCSRSYNLRHNNNNFMDIAYPSPEQNTLKNLNISEGKVQMSLRNHDNCVKSHSSRYSVSKMIPHGKDDFQSNVWQDPGKESGNMNNQFSEVETEVNVTKHLKVLPGLGKEPVYGCTFCRFTHPIRSKVLKHIHHTHKKAQIFRCSICNFSCTRKTEWSSHKLSHSTKRIHSCKECKYQTNFYRNYVRHMYHHSGKAGPVKCNYCTYSSTGEGAVQRHMREFHREEEQDITMDHILQEGSSGTVLMPVQTPEIPKNPFRQDEISPSTPLTIDVSPTRSESPPICSECGVMCKSKAHLSRHKVVHSSDQPFACNLCGLKYKRVSDLNRHIRKKHPRSLGDSGMSFSIKEENDMNNDSGNDFFLHEGSVEMPRTPELIIGSVSEQNGSEPLNLSVKNAESCDSDETMSMMPFQLVSNDSLLALNKNNPLRLKSPLDENEFSLQCSECSYLAKCRSDFKRHMMTHSEQKPHKCSLCSKRFKHKGDLNKHSRDKHGLTVGKPRKSSQPANENVYPWACLFCSFRCNMRNEIRIHLQAQHEESVIQYGHLEHLVDQTYSLVVDEKLQPVVINGKICCPYCSYQTLHQAKIKTHIEIHGNLKRYMCPDCGKRSNWIWDVRKHIRKEHPFSALDVVQLSEEEAKSTLPQYLESVKTSLLSRRSSSVSQLSDSSSSYSESPVPSQSLLRKMNPHERIRPFKCSSCGRRSNWKWDMQKHVNICPGSKLIVLDPEEAKATLAESLASPPPPVRRSQTKSHPSVRDYSYIKKLVADKHRPFKCSVCGKRSNWKWDLKKHIRNTHPVGQVITLTEEEAKSSQKDYISDKKFTKTGKPPLQVKWNLFEKFKHNIPKDNTGGIKVKATSPDRRSNIKSPFKEDTKEGGVNPSSQNNKATPTSVDNKRLKRFKCSVCYYRSNFKGDIKRHVQNFHTGVAGAKVVFMSEKEASATLATYNKKFLGRRRSRRDKMKFKNRKRPHTVPTPLSGVDLFNVVRAATPDTASISTTASKTDEDLSGTPSVSSQADVNDGAYVGMDDFSKTDVTFGGFAKKNYYECKTCYVWSTVRKAMDDHTRAHSKGSKYRCALCGDKSDYNNSITRHLRMKHKVLDPIEIKRLTKVTVTYRVLEDQPDGTALAQSVLSSSFDIQAKEENSEMEEDEVTDMLQLSNVMQPSTSSPRLSVPTYQCKMCGPSKASIHKYSIVRHLKKHHKEIITPDDYIERYESFDTPKPSNEIKPTVQKPTFEIGKVTAGHRCTVCPFVTGKKPRLTLHMTYHKPQPGHKYKCRHCPYFVNHPRLLHSHIRLHLQEQGLLPQVQTQVSFTVPEPKGPVTQKYICNNGVNGQKKLPSKSGKSAFQCASCPYVTFSKNDYLYHKQFHRPKPAAQYKCELCPYWITERRLLGLHMKVHVPNYRTTRLAGKQLVVQKTSQIEQPSPCKSDISELSLDDAVEIAYVKQQIIASKIKSVAVTPMKVRPEPLSTPEGDVMPSLIFDKQMTVSGTYKKYYQCRYCPWTNVRTRNLKLHEAMHGKDSRRPHQCKFCDYSVGNRGLLTHHIKVHSIQYRPGQDVVNDVEEELNTDSDQPETDVSKEGILFKVDEKETKERLVEPEGEKLETQALPEKSSKFYLKYSEQAKAHVLERAIMRKWCCEKCPYATLKKAQFENHILLHGCKQQYICQYCDYSVPTYHYLLQHEKIHHMPNPNLLNVQSISNLMRLPDIPADLAAAAGNMDGEPGHHDQLTSLFENGSQFYEPKKLYRCDRCPFSNVRREGLLSHLRCHLNRSEHKCKYCDYSVTKAHLLNQHVKIHFNLPGSEMNSHSLSKDDKWELPIVENSDIKKNGENIANKEKGEEGDKKLENDKDETGNKNKKARTEVCEDENENKLVDDTKDEDMVEQNNNPVSSCKTFICQYCDRAFQSSPKHNQHEKLHLLGTVH